MTNGFVEADSNGNLTIALEFDANGNVIAPQPLTGSDVLANHSNEEVNSFMGVFSLQICIKKISFAVLGRAASPEARQCG